MVAFKYVDVNGTGDRLIIDNGHFDAYEQTLSFGRAGVLYSDNGMAPALSYLHVKQGYHVVEYYTSSSFIREFDFSEEYTRDTYIYVDIQKDEEPTPPGPPTPTTDSYVRVFSNGSWHKAIPYVYSNGAWHKSKAYVYRGGWHEVK